MLCKSTGGSDGRILDISLNLGGRRGQVDLLPKAAIRIVHRGQIETDSLPVFRVVCEEVGIHQIDRCIGPRAFVDRANITFATLVSTRNLDKFALLDRRRTRCLMLRGRLGERRSEILENVTDMHAFGHLDQVARLKSLALVQAVSQMGTRR